MLGLATVLTEVGMEGVIPFARPAPVRPKPVQAVGPALVEEVSEAPGGRWMLAGGGVAAVVVLVSALVFALAFKPAVPARDDTARIRPIEEPPVPPADAPAVALPQTPATAAAPARASPPQRAVAPVPVLRSEAKPAARSASESVLVLDPQWSSNVRRMGEVDQATERSTMIVLDAIHDVQERERARQGRSGASREVHRER